jgi:hypothetical protein
MCSQSREPILSLERTLGSLDRASRAKFPRLYKFARSRRLPCGPCGPWLAARRDISRLSASNLPRSEATEYGSIAVRHHCSFWDHCIVRQGRWESSGRVAVSMLRRAVRRPTRHHPQGTQSRCWCQPRSPVIFQLFPTERELNFPAKFSHLGVCVRSSYKSKPSSNRLCNSFSTGLLCFLQEIGRHFDRNLSRCLHFSIIPY